MRGRNSGTADPTGGSDPIPVIPPGGLRAPSSTSAGQGARAGPRPQGVPSVRREPNTAKITVNVQEGEGTQRDTDESTKLVA